MNDVCINCEGAQSVTSARTDLAISNNGTWSDAWRFGTPGDLTWDLIGQKFAMDVQLNPYDATPKLSLSSDHGDIIIDDVVQRVIHMKVDAAIIQSNLRPGQYVYDLIMIDGANVRVPLMHGVLCVGQGVTYP